MREIRLSGSEGGARFKPWSLPLSEFMARAQVRKEQAVSMSRRAGY
jgi:hypothetical protein